MGSHRMRKAPPSAQETRAVLDDLRLLVRALRLSARDAEKQLGISGAQLFVLQCLDRGETLSMGALAERTHTDPSSVSVVVSRLARLGLLRRAASASDARRVEVRITPRGQKLVRGAPETTQVHLVRALEAMKKPARTRLAESLSALVAQMRLDESPRMFFEDERPVPAQRKKRNLT